MNQMIAPGDLQQNNIIKVNFEGRWRTVKVSAVFKTFILVTNPYTHVGLAFDYDNMIHGAGISVNWLLNFGWMELKPDGACMRRFMHPKSPITIYASGEKELRAKIYGDFIERPIRYLHELQNLHRAITNEPLYSETQLKPILSLE